MNIKTSLNIFLVTSFATAPVAAASDSWYQNILAHYPQVEAPYGDQYQLTLVPAEQRRVALSLFATDHTPQTSHVLLKNNPGASLGLFGETGLVKAIDRTKTAVGHAALAGMLVSASKQEVSQRQAAVRILAQNSQLADELHVALGKFAQAEEVFLKIYQPTEAPTIATPSTSMMGLKSTFNSIGAAANIFGIAVPLPGWAAATGLGATLGAFAAKLAGLPHVWNTFKKYAGYTCMPYQLHRNYLDAQNQAAQGGNADDITSAFNKKAIGLSALWFASACWGLYRYRTLATDLSATQVPLRALSVGLTTMEEVLKMVEGDDRLAAAIPELQSIKGLFDQYANRPEALKTLLEWLQNDTFKKPFSLMDSDSGTILAAQKLTASAVRLQLRNAFEAIGKLDAYLSMATLLTESKEKRYSFVKWVKRPQPLVKLTRLWSPVSDLQPSNISLGTDTRTIATTPEQTKPLAHALLLAHTFGVVPADEAEMTALDDMVVHCDGTQDSSDCLNSFASGRRATSLGMAIIDGPANDQHSNSDACVQLARKIAQTPNIVAVVATQCPHARSVLTAR